MYTVYRTVFVRATIVGGGKKDNSWLFTGGYFSGEKNKNISLRPIPTLYFFRSGRRQCGETIKKKKTVYNIILLYFIAVRGGRRGRNAVVPAVRLFPSDKAAPCGHRRRVCVPRRYGRGPMSQMSTAPSLLSRRPVADPDVKNYTVLLQRYYVNTTT